MNRDLVEEILKEQGWVTENKQTSSYIEWYKDGNIVYLGNWYIEVDTQAEAYPYKEDNPKVNKENLIKYINGESDFGLHEN